MTWIFHAPAKINLTLEVLARRDDGLHGVRSVMVPLDLTDEMTVEPSETFSFACDRAELAGDDNLVVRAFRALQASQSYRVVLQKRIPLQAGLGGGSSDAAAVLRAAMAGTFDPLPPLDWLKAARSLGSDVPFFLAGTGALVEGTGERVTPLGSVPPWHVLVVKPPANVSTATAYARLDESERPARNRRTSASLAMLTALQRGSFAEVQRLLHNDFQAPMCQSTPSIARAMDALRNAGASNALLAGSGSCVFTLAYDRTTLESIAERLALPEDYLRFPCAFAQTPDWRT